PRPPPRRARSRLPPLRPDGSDAAPGPRVRRRGPLAAVAVPRRAAENPRASTRPTCPNVGGDLPAGVRDAGPGDAVPVGAGHAAVAGLPGGGGVRPEPRPAAGVRAGPTRLGPRPPPVERRLDLGRAARRGRARLRAARDGGPAG